MRNEAPISDPAVNLPLGVGSSHTIPIYERDLDRDLRWALSEGSRFFEGKSAVQAALRKITRRLGDLGIPYAVAGGMALFAHGYRRFTEDVNILVTIEGLKALHSHLDGRGYLPPFTQSKNLRDTEFGVKIEFLLAGQYPGDGKPKPVTFPDPAEASVEIEGVRYLSLVELVQLKLASGMTEPGRMRDLSDVMELIKLLKLPREFTQKLDPFVREKYLELWQIGRTRCVTTWKNKLLAASVQSLDEMIQRLREAADTLQSMSNDGVTLGPGGKTPVEGVLLVTTDPEVARKYNMYDEAEFWEPVVDPETTE